jgi:hypothetical protein
MKSFFTAVSLIIGTICLFAGQASATPVAIGDPFNSGSWSAKFKQSNIGGGFDRIEAFVVKGNKFKNGTGMENLNNSDWTASFERTDYTHAEGKKVEELTLELHFDGEHDDNKDVVHTGPVDVVFLTWCDKEIKEDYHASWDGDDWCYEDHTGDHENHDDDRDSCGHPTAPVPEPGTMMLLGFGMLGMAIYGKRRMNKEA